MALSDTAYAFPGFYSERMQRWGAGLGWSRRIGMTPKDLRDQVATILRGNNVNERVLGSILGHTPKNSTGLYGSVPMEAKLEALLLVR